MKNPLRRNKASVPSTAIGRKDLTPDGRLVTEFQPAITQMLRLYGVGSSYAQMYARQPNIRVCIDTIARESAGLTLKMYEKVPRAVDLPDDRIEIGDHRMAQLLDEPAPGQSTYRFYYALFADLETFDRAIWLKVRSKGQGTPPDGLLRIPPQQLWPLRDPLTGVVQYWYSVRGLRLDPADLVVFWGYDPDINHGYVPIMETLRRTLAEEWAAGMNREGMWKNSLRKDGIIEQDLEAVKMSDAARESYLIDVADSLSGQSGSGSPLMLEPGQHWKDSVWSPREMEYINARRLTRLECAAAFHIPPALVSANINGVEADDSTMVQFYSSSLPPRLERVEAEIKAQLLPEFDMVATVRRRHYVEFNIDAKLRGSFEKQAAIAATAVGGPFVTVNEMRARMNLPPVKDGDEIFIPLNSIRGGGPQAGPQSPTDTPAGGINPTGTTPGGGTQQTQDAVNNADSSGPTQGVMPDGGGIPGKARSLEEELHSDITAADDRREALKNAKDHALFMKESRLRYQERAQHVIEKFFSRQRNAAEGGKSVDSERWVKELDDELFGIAFQTVEIFGADSAKRIKGTWSSDRTANFLKTNCAREAKQINDETVLLLNQDPPNLEVAFGEPRATKIASARTTFAMNWSVIEAVHQNEA